MGRESKQSHLQSHRQLKPLTLTSCFYMPADRHTLQSIQRIVEIPLEEVVSEFKESNEVRHGAYRKNSEPCLICGKGVRTDRPHKRVHLLTNGNIVSSAEDFENSQGSFAVGNDCAKRLVINFVFNSSDTTPQNE